MATAKVTINGRTIIDLTNTTTDADDTRWGARFYNDEGEETFGEVPERGYLDITNFEKTVYIPAGIYRYDQSKNVDVGYIQNPTATKGTVSNHSVSVTPSVTATEGYVAGGTRTGTAVSVSASELVSGTKSISSNGSNIDVTNYANVDVSVPSSSANLQTKNKSYTPTETAQTETVTADSGYDGLDEVIVSVGAISSNYVGSGITRRSSSDLEVYDDTVVVPAGFYSQDASAGVHMTTVATPVATKGTLSTLTHSIDVTPSITQPYGFVDATTKTGTPVTVSASELDTGTVYIDDAGDWNVVGTAVASVPAGSVSNPTATKGSVSNHSVSVTPSVSHTEGFIGNGSKNGTAVSVSASELVSGNLPITANGNNIDVTNYATVSVNVSSSGMNKQAYFGSATTSATTYTATTVSLTVAVTGTYKVSWTGWRNTTSGTSGSQLYRTRSGSTTAIGTANTTFQNSYGHRVELTGQQFNKDDVITVYARARTAQYVMGVANLVIEQTA